MNLLLLILGTVHKNTEISTDYYVTATREAYIISPFVFVFAKPSKTAVPPHVQPPLLTNSNNENNNHAVLFVFVAQNVGGTKD